MHKADLLAGQKPVPYDLAVANDLARNNGEHKSCSLAFTKQPLHRVNNKY